MYSGVCASITVVRGHEETSPILVIDFIEDIKIDELVTEFRILRRASLFVAANNLSYTAPNLSYFLGFSETGT
jgi:hypothetical protein